MRHSLVRDTTLPEQEDLPLVLARITVCDDVPHRCEWRPSCRRMAAFTHASYEDGNVIKDDLRRGVPMKQVEEKLWQHTMHEQMQNRFTVHETIFICRDCLLDNLMYFLNTKKDVELREMLTGMDEKKYALVIWHFLSYPEMGLCTPTPLEIATPQAFQAWLKAGVRVEWKLKK